jgi:hypothetical protein
MQDLTDAIRQFDATEANLKRLDELWVEIEGLIPNGMVVDTTSPDATRYASLCRTFRHIRKALPKLDGFELADSLVDLDDVFQNRFDAADLGEISANVSVERDIYSQGEALQEYRFRLLAQRRELVRLAMKQAISDVDRTLAKLGGVEFPDQPCKVTAPEWNVFKGHIAEIDVLRGTAIASPDRWGELHRHLHFGLTCDLHDIVVHDWPAARESLQKAMYGPHDPLPVEATDLGALVRAAPGGPVVTALKWDAIDDEGFERLVYNVVADAPGYTNPQWLTNTRAPDRGRDISASKSVEDALSGTRVMRVIIQCRHWLTRSISMDDITTLVNQMALWEPPKVDELITATSGRFTTDAVDWIERHNNDRRTPYITMWPNSHLESLLAVRPHLVAMFHLR